MGTEIHATDTPVQHLGTQPRVCFSFHKIYSQNPGKLKSGDHSRWLQRGGVFETWYSVPRRAPLSPRPCSAAMRTPAPMIVGIVLGPCSLVLNLTSTLAPSWRIISQIPGSQFGLIEHQGIWQLCTEFDRKHMNTCNNVEDTLGYFSQLPVQAAKGLMPASLVLLGIGLVVTTLGVRCWQDMPHYLLAGLGGLLIFPAGVLNLIAISWYNYELYNLPSPADSTVDLSYCLVLGYLSSCMEIIGGISLTISFRQYQKERKLKKATMEYSYSSRNQQGLGAIPSISATVESRGLQIGHKNPGPRSYSNSLDVLDDERNTRSARLPCDSDL